MVSIEFIKGVSETVLPLIKMTRSKNGKTGTATFVFINPLIFEKLNQKNFLKIEAVSLVSKQKSLFTQELELLFKKGKPYLIKATFFFKKDEEWFHFLSFMSNYSKENSLLFSEKTELSFST
jgi:photosystem II protein